MRGRGPLPTLRGARLRICGDAGDLLGDALEAPEGVGLGVVGAALHEAVRVHEGLARRDARAQGGPEHAGNQQAEATALSPPIANC